MSIVKLPSRHWHTIADLFDNEFNSDLPRPDSANIYIATEKGQRTGFINVENVQMVGQIYVYPEFREKDASKTVRDLIRFVRDRAKTGDSICTLASEARFKRLYQQLGMKKIDGDLFRINF